MKKFAVALVLMVGMSLMAAGALAQTVYTYPADEPVFAIAFPDDWAVELDEDDAGVIALAADEEIEIDIWPLDAAEVADDVNAALASAAEEIDELLADNIKDFQPGDAETIEINGITFLEIAGPATYLEDDSAASISVDFFSPDGETVFAMVY